MSRDFAVFMLITSAAAIVAVFMGLARLLIWCGTSEETSIIITFGFAWLAIGIVSFFSRDDGKS